MSFSSSRITDRALRSPCINVCVLNEADVCEGCFRTANEIQCWSGMDADERKQTLERTWERARASGNVL